MPFVEVAASRLPKPFQLYYELHGNGPQKILFMTSNLVISDLFPSSRSAFLITVVSASLALLQEDIRTTSEMAKDTSELLDALGWKSGVHLVGISMGFEQAGFPGFMASDQSGTLLASSRNIQLDYLDIHPCRPYLPAVPYLLATKDPKIRAKEMLTLLFTNEHLAKPAPEGSPYATRKDFLYALSLERASRSQPSVLQGVFGQLFAANTHYVSVERLTRLKESGIPILIIVGTYDNVWDRDE
ncbi:hypothetical protein HK102_004819 [Quaeritorhiza haematococci]|nr:hypothetical protein HK102_004819 [Quaeritorhiza haematococci]